MNFEEALAYMGGLMRFGWKLDNSRIEALCKCLGDPHLSSPVIHIAGTKGKGSTTAFAARILQEQGYRVGAYFSPYVFDVRERVQLNGEPISKEDFARILTRLKPIIENLAETEIGQTTEFELKTALAFVYFAEQKADYVCLEVGIGGRLDATNVVNPVVTIITNIGLDHTEILGETYALIAAEKAGIIKPGAPCFTATDNPDALEVIERIAKERSAPLTRVRYGDTEGSSESMTVFWKLNSEIVPPDFAPVTISTQRAVYRDMPVRMGGAYQRENAACAVAATEEALAIRGERLQEEAVRRALAETSLPGRLTIYHSASGMITVVDGAHNGLAAQKLATAVKSLMQMHAMERLFLVIAMVGGHDPDDVISKLAPMAQRCFATQVEWKRAISAEMIAETARKYCEWTTVISSPAEAVAAAREQADPRTLILITGSLYLAGALKPETLTD